MNQKTFQKVSQYSNIPNMAIYFLLPTYCISLGFSPLETTGLFAIMSLALLVTKLIIGGVCDKIGRKRIFCAGLILQGISYVVMAFSSSAVPLYIAQVIKGFSMSLVSVSMFAMMSDDSTLSFAQRQSRIEASVGQGGIVGVVICFILLTSFSLRDTWKYLLLIGAIAAGYAYLIANKSITETYVDAVSEKFILAPKLKKVFLIYLLFVTATNVISVILILYLYNVFSVDISKMAMLLFGTSILITLLSPAIGKKVSALGNRVSFFVGCITAFILLRIIPFSNTIILFTLLWIAYNIAISFCSYSINSFIAVNSQEHARGKTTGAFMASSNLGSFIGAILSGVLFERISPQMPFFVSAIIMLIVALFMYRFCFRKRCS